MIDHLDIESVIISRNSSEGKKQLQKEFEKGEKTIFKSLILDICVDSKRAMKLKQSLKAEEEEDEMKESKKRTRVNVFPHIDTNIFFSFNI